MNSWMDSSFPACLPPFRTLKDGTGKRHVFTPPRYLYNGNPNDEAAAFAAARETPRMALAPRLALFGVPSSSIISSSSSRWAEASIPRTSWDMTSLTFFTAFWTPFPSYLSPPSRSSRASWVPVDAPDGTAARPKPQQVQTSTSTVGFPRESRISRA